MERGRAALARMDLGLADSPFLAGDAFSLADICLVAYTRMAHQGGFDLAEFPSVETWVKRVDGELKI
jgi:glutathione S-transferase